MSQAPPYPNKNCVGDTQSWHNMCRRGGTHVATSKWRKNASTEVIQGADTLGTTCVGEIAVL